VRVNILKTNVEEIIKHFCEQDGYRCIDEPDLTDLRQVIIDTLFYLQDFDIDCQQRIDHYCLLQL